MSLIHVSRSHAAYVPSLDVPEDSRWCFKCRKRHGGVWQLMAEPEGSYYEDWWRYRCAGCNEDHRHFPGCGAA